MFFVYYNDDYEDAGGVGLEKFKTGKEVQEWLTERITSRNSDSRMYTVIAGEEIGSRVIKEIVRTE